MLATHGWRTKDPKEAELLVVPFLWEVSVSEAFANETDCHGLSHEERIQRAFLEADALARRLQKKHRQFTMAHYFSAWNWLQGFDQAIVGHYEERDKARIRPWRCTAVFPYFNNITDDTLEAVDFADFLKRPVGIFFRTSFARTNGAQWLRAQAPRLAEQQVQQSGRSRREVGGGEAGWRLPLRVNVIYGGHRPFMLEHPGEVCPKEKKKGYTPKAKYSSEFLSSRFCLVIRGDTSSSSRLYEAIAAWCLPVLISDPWLEWGAPWPELLDYKTFVIFVSERDWMEDLPGVYARLEGMSEEELARRFDNMGRARRVLLYRHPRSTMVGYALEHIRRKCLSSAAAEPE